jgi:PAS domain S-box-containing protein
MRLFANLSIRAKLTAIISLLFWTVSVFIFIYFPARTRTERLADISENARYVAVTTANLITRNGAPLDSGALYTALQNAKLVGKLTYAVAVSDKGDVLVAYKPALAERAGYTDVEDHISTDPNVFKTSAEIPGPAGTVYVGLSLDEFDARLADDQTSTAWVSLVIFLIGVVTVIGASTVVTTPLRNMVETVEQIARGNLVKRARVSSQDEVGHLAFSFNKMVGNLKQAYEELEKANQTLEQRVEERTRALNEEIQERRRIEDALRESESRNRAVLSALPDIMLLRDRHGAYTPDPVELLPPGDLEMHQTRAQLAWELLARFEPAIQDAIDTGDLQVVEYTLPYSAGPRFFEARMARSGSDQAVVIVREITERRNAESQLMLQGAALEAAANALSIMDAVGRLIWINPAFTQLTGYTADEVQRRHFSFLHPDGETPEEVWERIAAGLVWHGELVSRRKDGSEYIEEQTITPVLNAAGTPEHFISIRTDITERKRIERSLIEAKESVEAADKLKDAFIANISHGIRTPLYIMIGYLNHIAGELRGIIPPEQEKYFGFIFESADRLTKSIDLILDISRLQTGTIEFQNTDISLPDLVQTKVAELRPQAEIKGLTIAFDNNFGRVSVHADEGFLAKCLEGILENAVKFTRRGYVQVRLAAGPDRTVLLEVEDTGVGISDEYQSRMFQITTPNDDGAGHAFEGVGLGLALVKRYLDQIGGTITVKSARGVGSIFSIMLPADIVTHAEQRSSAPVVSVERTVPTPAEVRTDDNALPRLLVIEDDADTRQFMSITLRKHYRVSTAENVAEANEVLNGSDVDIIIVDVSLGGEESGLDFITHLRKIPRFRSIPVIAVTAHAFTSDRDRCINAGCDWYFSKPVDHAVLLRTMADLLREKVDHAS